MHTHVAGSGSHAAGLRSSTSRAARLKGMPALCDCTTPGRYMRSSRQAVNVADSQQHHQHRCCNAAARAHSHDCMGESPAFPYARAVRLIPRGTCTLRPPLEMASPGTADEMQPGPAGMIPSTSTARGSAVLPVLQRFTQSCRMLPRTALCTTRDLHLLDNDHYSSTAHRLSP